VCGAGENFPPLTLLYKRELEARTGEEGRKREGSEEQGREGRRMNKRGRGVKII
jgi:hypothetical protein